MTGAHDVGFLDLIPGVSSAGVVHHGHGSIFGFFSVGLRGVDFMVSKHASEPYSYNTGMSPVLRRKGPYFGWSLVQGGGHSDVLHL